MAATYSKHKDRSPEETVERITSILDTIGIETEVLGLNHPFLGTYSNRVQIKGTRIGANGKGTTEAYALASGYAELIERIQNGVLAQRFYHAHLHETCGFYHFADERLLTPAELMDESRGIVDV